MRFMGEADPKDYGGASLLRLVQTLMALLDIYILYVNLIRRGHNQFL